LVFFDDFMKHCIGVIVPFFQRKTGLLTRAIQSVFDQTYVGRIVIIIVDDGSPCAARCELDGFLSNEVLSIELIEQSNAGVAAARNRALEAMPADVDVIAFLDPDDSWHPDHLARAAVALDLGCDFYFADHVREGAVETRFAECGLVPERHRVLEPPLRLFAYEGSLFDAIVRQSPVGTSTVVFRKAIAARIRFKTSLSASEDSLFWLNLLQQNPRVGFCGDVTVQYGVGVNLFASATWGTARNLRYLADIAAYHRSLPRLFSLSPDLAVWNEAWCRQVRRDFVLNLLHLARRRQAIDWRVLAGYWAREPMMTVDAARIIAGQVRGRVR